MPGLLKPMRFTIASRSTIRKSRGCRISRLRAGRQRPDFHMPEPHGPEPVHALPRLVQARRQSHAVRKMQAGHGHRSRLRHPGSSHARSRVFPPTPAPQGHVVRRLGIEFKQARLEQRP